MTAASTFHILPSSFPQHSTHSQWSSGRWAYCLWRDVISIRHKTKWGHTVGRCLFTCCRASLWLTRLREPSATAPAATRQRQDPSRTGWRFHSTRGLRLRLKRADGFHGLHRAPRTFRETAGALQRSPMAPTWPGTNAARDYWNL
jgi:hypothetical protein